MKDDCPSLTHVSRATNQGFKLILAAAVALSIAQSCALARLLSPSVGNGLIVALVVVIGFAAFARYTQWAILLMLAIAPFYDLVRAVAFPDVALLGAWQDVAVVGFGIVAIRNASRADFRLQWSRTDWAVIIFIALYALSALFTPNLTVWFYIFRWSTLYAFFYLAMKTYRFTDRELEAMLATTTVALLVSAAIGYGLFVMLGSELYFTLWRLLGLTVYGRAGQFRWLGTFGNPLVASAAYGLLVIISAAYMLERRAFRTHVVLAFIGFAACAGTLSRSGWAVAVAGIVGMVWVANRGLLTNRKALALIGGMLVLAGISIAITRPEMFRVATTEDSADALRFESFKTVLLDSFRYPFGVGLGTAGGAADAALEIAGINTNTDPVVGDSVLFQVLRDIGWIGVWSLLAVCAGFIRAAMRGFRGSENLRIRIVMLVALAFFLGNSPTS